MADNTKYILCIYSNLKYEWSLEDLNQVLKWLYNLTSAETCKDAIALAWMEVSTHEEQNKLGAIRDFYLGQYDGKIFPPLNLEKLYREVNGLNSDKISTVII